MSIDADKKVPIFVNRTKIEVSRGPMTGRQILAAAGFDDQYELFLLNGEGDPTGGRKIGLDETVEIKAGLHFNALPSDITFGSAENLCTELLQADAKRLAEALSRAVECSREGDRQFVVVKAYPLPQGVYTQPHSDVLLITDAHYPLSAMDMYYTEPEATLAGRPVPDYASSVERYVGRLWRRWSRHRQSGKWKVGVDNLVTHWSFVEGCLPKERQRG